MAARPRRVQRLGRGRALLGLLSEQPDRRRRAALVLRGAGRASAGARVSPLLRRGVLGALVRRAAGVGAAGRRPLERRRLQHALEALVDDGVPLRVHVRATGDRAPRCAASGRLSGPRRRSSCNAPRSPRGRTTRTSTACARSTGASATPCCRLSRRAACGSQARTRRSISGSTSAARPEPFCRRLLEHGIVAAPGSFFGAAGEGYARFALVPTQAQCERAAEILREIL